MQICFVMLIFYCSGPKFQGTVPLPLEVESQGSHETISSVSDFIQVNQSSVQFDSEHLHGKHTKENQTLVTFLTTDMLPGLFPRVQNREHIQIFSGMLWI